MTEPEDMPRLPADDAGVYGRGLPPVSDGATRDAARRRVRRTMWLTLAVIVAVTAALIWVLS